MLRMLHFLPGRSFDFRTVWPKLVVSFPFLRPMKILRLPLFAALAGLLATTAPSLRAAAAAGVPSGDRLYVTIAYDDPIGFARFRLAQAGGAELILTTLKDSAAEQARFAGYAGEVVVLDENAKAPEGAPVLLLNWNRDDVTASVTLNGKENYLGVVSRAHLSDHPDYKAMRAEIERNRLRAERRDAELRAATRMQLYQGLKYFVLARQKSAGA